MPTWTMWGILSGVISILLWLLKYNKVWWVARFYARESVGGMPKTTRIVNAVHSLLLVVFPSYVTSWEDLLPKREVVVGVILSLSLELVLSWGVQNGTEIDAFSGIKGEASGI